MTRQINIRLEVELIEKLEKIAKKKHCKVSQAMREAVRAYVETGGNLDTSPALHLEEIRKSLQEIRWMITQIGPTQIVSSAEKNS